MYIVVHIIAIDSFPLNRRAFPLKLREHETYGLRTLNGGEMKLQEPVPKKAISADWLVRGVLTKVGDTFDRFTGRRWVPSSSLATSELIEQLKKLLDAEVRDVPGKGMVVPHDIRLKMQWNKFSDDSEKGIAALRTELMTAAADHINNSLYYTFAPLSVEVNADYFTEGVKLTVGFGSFDEEEEGVELDVRLPSSVAAGDTVSVKENTPGLDTLIVSYSLEGRPFRKAISVPANGRISVGRTSENVLALEHSSISKLHATIVVQSDGTLALADTGSTNGTFVNGERISYGKSVPLTSADNIRFGSVDVTLEAVPKTVEIVPVDEVIPDANTVEIDGFEFTRKTAAEETVEFPAPQPPAVTETVEFLAPQPRAAEETVELLAPQPPIAEKTILISPISTEKPEDSTFQPVSKPKELPEGEGE